MLQCEYLKEQRTAGATRHQPLLAASALAAAICRLELKGAMYMDLMVTLQLYMQQCGICERISRTPIPMPYSRCVASLVCSAQHVRQARCSHASFSGRG